VACRGRRAGDQRPARAPGLRRERAAAHGAEPLQARLPGLRVDPALPGSPALAYDRAGTIVATIYVRTLREVGAKGFDHIGPTAQPITYVSLYPVAASSGQPEALVTIVLWHVSPSAAAALR